MSIEAMKVEGPLHVICQCDKCKAEKQEPVVGTKTWVEDGKVVTQNLYASDIYKDQPQRQWANLTEDEITGIILSSGGMAYSAIKFTQNKLKEKNCG